MNTMTADDAVRRHHVGPRSSDVAKRAVDVVVGTVVAVAVLPAVVVMALAVMVSLRTWRPLFVQRRVGWGGSPFTIVKLRTLPHATPRDADKYAVGLVRTTRVGRFLRTTHLDELPQLFLVPVGLMSLVGPRPEMFRLAAEFDPTFASVRAAVRPGCTGLWQVSVDAGRLIAEVPHYDWYYVRHRSLRLDCWILWRTLRVLVPGARRTALADVPAWSLAGAEAPRPAADGPLVTAREARVS